jgi:hypothetical protein
MAGGTVGSGMTPGKMTIVTTGVLAFCFVDTRHRLLKALVCA